MREEKRGHQVLSARGGGDGSRRVASHVRVLAAGAYVPGPPVSTAEVENRIAAASPGLHVRRGLLQRLTGIKSRHLMPDTMQASDLAIEAAKQALNSAGMATSEVDLLIWGSASQDLVEPATAHIVAAKLGLRCPVFDIKNACNSFLNAMQIGTALVAARSYRNVLIVTGESPSRAIRWSVHNNRDFIVSGAGYTMGDAGAALLLGHDARCEGVFFQDHRAWSKHWSIATLPGGGSMHPRGDQWTYFSGNGTRLRDAFKSIGPGLLSDALAATRTRYEDYKAILCHQVTLPFLEMFCREAGLPPDRLVVTVPDLGNIASATLPTQLARSMQQGRVGPGDQIMLIGLAGGLSMGVMLMTL